MVGDHPVADRVRALYRFIGRISRGLDQVIHQIRVVIIMLSLQHGTDTFQPHAGINAGLGQVNARAIGLLLILHEHQIPNLDKAITILIGAAGRAARNALAMVEENLRTRAARTGIAHRPEIITGRDADNLIFRQTGDFLPQRISLIVFGINRGQQFLSRQLQLFGQEVPRIVNGLFLEIITEGKITQHLKKRVMARRIADIVEVIMLPAGAHAFLR